jgi:hypothetical protein
VLEDYAGSTFQPGQVWRYRARPGEEDSTLTVLKVETHPELGVIVHVAVSGVRVRNPLAPSGYAGEIGHLPFAEEAVLDSVTDRVQGGAPTGAGEEGYREWRRAFDAGEGGVFTTSVAEAVGFIEQALGQGGAG